MISFNRGPCSYLITPETSELNLTQSDEGHPNALTSQTNTQSAVLRLHLCLIASPSYVIADIIHWCDTNHQRIKLLRKNSVNAYQRHYKFTLLKKKIIDDENELIFRYPNRKRGVRLVL